MDHKGREQKHRAEANGTSNKRKSTHNAYDCIRERVGLKTQPDGFANNVRMRKGLEEFAGPKHHRSAAKALRGQGVDYSAPLAPQIYPGDSTRFTDKRPRTIFDID
jgi:hypothetical protein